METQHHMDEEGPDSSSGCGCFNFFRPFKPLNDSEHRQRKRQLFGETARSWSSSQARKAKELSELIAGPKWKNFIRKVGGYCNGNSRKKQSKTRFQYDPQSYALNFDDSGFGREDQQEEEEEEEQEGLLVH